MSNKYFNETIQTSSSVWFKLLNAKGGEVRDYVEQPCYREIFSGGIPKETIFIVLYRDKKCVPYEIDAVDRFVSDLCEMGFPCQRMEEPLKSINIRIDLRDYQYKAHLFGALFLLRLLSEQGLCKALGIYLNLMDDNPALDKIDAIQTAHKTIGTYAPTGHMATYKNNGKNVSQETLFKRYIASKHNVYYNGTVSQYDKWSG